MKPGDLVMDICDYADVEGMEDLQGRVGIVIEVIDVSTVTFSGKFEADAPSIVEVLMEDGFLEEFEINELEVISESR